MFLKECSYIPEDIKKNSAAHRNWEFQSSRKIPDLHDVYFDKLGLGLTAVKAERTFVVLMLQKEDI